MLNLVIISDAGAGQGSGRRMEKTSGALSNILSRKALACVLFWLAVKSSSCFPKGGSWKELMSISFFFPSSLSVSEPNTSDSCSLSLYYIHCAFYREALGDGTGLWSFVSQSVATLYFSLPDKNIFALCKNLTLPSWLEITPRSSQHIPRSLSVITCGCQKCCCRWQKSVCC